MTDPTLLVIGARPNSLGAAIAGSAEHWPYARVHTAGISGENFKLDVTNSATIREVLDAVRPDNIVCTVGVNEMVPHDDPYLQSKMTDAFRTNVIGPMEVLRHFDALDDYNVEGRLRKFVAISSNSARIARTNSIAYCASKAALSMALRVAAREQARRLFDRILVWGYEPGLLDTVMTDEVDSRLGDTLHRMPGVTARGLDPLVLADRILGDLALEGMSLNGCLVQFDAGEQ